MKNCKDCRLSCLVSLPIEGGLACSHPAALGGSAKSMRAGGWLASRLMGTCGKGARYFIAIRQEQTPPAWPRIDAERG